MCHRGWATRSMTSQQVSRAWEAWHCHQKMLRKLQKISSINIHAVDISVKFLCSWESLSWCKTSTSKNKNSDQFYPPSPCGVLCTFYTWRIWLLLTIKIKCPRQISFQNSHCKDRYKQGFLNSEEKNGKSISDKLFVLLFWTTSMVPVTYRPLLCDNQNSTCGFCPIF